MSAHRWVPLSLLAVSILAGTVSDRSPERSPLTLGGYRVIAADLHTHSSWSNGGLTPWGLVLEARRQGLDALAVTGHNKVYDSRVAAWFSRHLGGPVVLTGQEIQTATSHVVAVGVREVIDWRQDVDRQIDAVHGQGGVAIAAHPFAEFWPGFEQTARERLDGSEICHPAIFVRENAGEEFERFARSSSMAAIGSSDFHGFGRLGLCRTYVFARDETQAAIIEALRSHRTVVYGLGGRAYGDPGLIELADERPELREIAVSGFPPGWMEWLSRSCGILGLLTLLVFERGKRRPAVRRPMEQRGMAD